MVTGVRLFAGVCPSMYSQRASLNEGFATPVEIAPEWPLIGVYPIMPLEIGFAVETLATTGQLPSRVIASRGWSARGASTHLTTGVPIALEGASRGFIIHEFQDFHF